MSRGLGAFASLFSEDNLSVTYRYGSYDLNQEKYKNSKHIMDGYIIIQKSCFKEPEIHKKLKKIPGGRKKLIIKKIPVEVDYSSMIMNNLIKIKNCSNAHDFISGEEKIIDIMALHIIYYIFYRYQINGNIPKSITYDV